MKEQCPVCRKENCVSEIAKSNVENYGSKVLKLACVHCNSPLTVSISRIVRVEKIITGNFTHDDFGNKCKTLDIGKETKKVCEMCGNEAGPSGLHLSKDDLLTCEFCN